MYQIRRILCPTDFSDASAHAIEQAIALAARHKARITALHVHRPPYVALPGLPVMEGLDTDLSRVQEETAARFRAATDGGVDVDVLIDVGEPADRILDRADALSADMIVMGTHGASGFQHFVLGSVTEKVLRKANCAVLTVPPRALAISSLPFVRVLCPVDFSDPSLAAFHAAVPLANSSHAALTLLHVIEWPWQEPPAPAARDLPPAQAAALAEFRRYLETTALMRLETLVAGAALDPPPTPRIAHGKPYVEILRVATEDRADLIVIGVHGRNVFDMALFGSTTNQIVRQATCPVLTLRQ
jgi:nucleotide-binding universal stress UspA family protein